MKIIAVSGRFDLRQCENIPCALLDTRFEAAGIGR
jgi:hypothetical protein